MPIDAGDPRTPLENKTAMEEAERRQLDNPPPRNDMTEFK
jgi:hypothetical protein